MKNFFFILIFILPDLSYSQNISIDFRKWEMAGTGSIGDTSLTVLTTKIKDSLVYLVFYRTDTVLGVHRRFFHEQDLDSITRRMIHRGIPLTGSGFTVKQKKVNFKLKKSYHYRVGMMPQFGWWIGKVRPGRYKQFGYRLRVYNDDDTYTETYIHYYFNKQSFFKRFFKKRKLKRRIKRLPLLLGADGYEIIFKNDMIQEGGAILENFYLVKVISSK